MAEEEGKKEREKGLDNVNILGDSKLLDFCFSLFRFFGKNKELHSFYVSIIIIIIIIVVVVQNVNCHLPQA